MTAEAVIWHDVECGSYVEDLPVWEELGTSPVLDIGAGTGRVSMHLARLGRQVTALDSDPDLLGALAARARAEGLRVVTRPADARSFALRRTFGAAIAPMQVAQLLGGAPGRAAMLDSVRAHLEPGGLFAVALADPFTGSGSAGASTGEGGTPDDYFPPLPDVLEEKGHLYQSTPVAVHARDGGAEIERIRERVAPDGTLVRSGNVISLDLVAAAEVEAEAEAHRFGAGERLEVPATQDYVGSTIVVLEAR